MLELLNYTFFQSTFLAALLVNIACRAVGVLVMINRLFSMAGGITRDAFGSIGLAIYFSLPILLSTSTFTLFLAFLVAFLSRHYQDRSDNFIAVIWAFGIAVGIILIDLSPGQSSDLMAYLFGSILAVLADDLWLVAFVDSAFVLFLFLLYRQFEVLSLDKEFAKVKGIHTSFFHYLLVAMLAFCIVISIRLVGLILVMAMLSIPSFVAEFFAKRLGAMMLISSCISGVFCVLGLFISAAFNLSSGACIIGIFCLFFVLHFAFRLIKCPK